jgi:predicted transcriptional regulator with HTH domain
MSDICNEYRYVYALRRSRVRLSVLRFLVRFILVAFQHLRLAGKQVIIYPMFLEPCWGVRYSVDNSLVNLGMAEFLVVGNHRLYRATRLGIACLKVTCSGEICRGD